MWLAILLLAPIAIVAQAHYLSREVVRAVDDLWPRGRRGVRIGRRVYLVASYSVPVLLVGYIAYVLIARPEVGMPSHWLLEYLVIYPFWVITIVTAQCVLLVGPVHLLRAAAGRLAGPPSPAWTRRYRGYVLAVTALFAVTIPARIALSSGDVEIRRYRIEIADLPPELEGFRVALVSDPQADAFTTGERISAMVDAVNAEEPDLALVAGDIITRDPAYIEPAARALGELRARLGVFSAIGDHDNFAYRDRERSVAEIRAGLERYGIALDDNRVHRFGELAVVVATHNYINRITEAEARAVLGRAAGAAVVIVVAHQAGGPLLEAARDSGADLYLAGHTHGGQVRLWWFGLDVVGARIESPYITGLYRGGELGDLRLIVSSGLGFSIMPFRYRAPATAEIIELTRAR